METKKFLLNKIEISESQAKDLANKYLRTYMVMDAFFAGIPVETPEGTFEAIVD